ncbi:MAG: hypothetical protein Q4E36_05880 [Bacillota bacterium]|nr:hypothetical protein [Bacillota bacterium]
MNYSELLTYLIDITDLKLKDISGYINYDVSYISKWTNGHNLPTVKQNTYISKVLADVFSTVIFNNGLEDKVKNLFKSKLDLSSKTILRKRIYNALISAYFCSENSNKQVFPADDFLIMGEDNITEFIYKAFSSPINNEKVVVYSTLDIDYLEYLLDFDDNFVLFSNEAVVDLNFIVNKSDDILTFDSRASSISMLSHSFFYDFNIYRYPFDKRSFGQFVYVKDKFILFFSMDANNRPVLISFSKSKAALSLADSLVESIFLEEYTVAKTVSNYDYFDVFLRNNLYPNTELYIFISFFDGYFLPKSLLERLLAKRKISDFEKNSLRNLLKIQKHFVGSLSNYIAVNFSPLCCCMSKREICLGNYTFKLTKKEFDSYINTALDNIADYSDHSFYFINSNSIFSGECDYPINIFISENFFVCKKISSQKDNNDKYFISGDPSIVATGKKMFFDINESSLVDMVDNTTVLNNLLSNYEALNLID